MRVQRLGGSIVRVGLALALALTAAPIEARAEDKLLAEAVDFTGTFIFLEAKVPGLVIGTVRNGETVVRGFGEISDGSGKAPDGDTLIRIGSITAAQRWRAWGPPARSISPTSSRTGRGGTSPRATTSRSD